MRLVQTRPCDGACCREVPLAPTSLDRATRDCKYRDPSMPERGCLILAGKAIPTEEEMQRFPTACRDWPHNMPPTRKIGPCCWEWINGD